MSKDQVTDKTANAEEDEEGEIEGDEPAEEQQPIRRGKRADPFSAAFEAAEKALAPEKKPAPRRKARADAQEDEEESDEKAAKQKAESDPAAQKKPSKPAVKAKAAAEPKEDDAGDDESDDDEGESAETAVAPRKDAKAKPAEKETKAAPDADKKAKEALQPKGFWSRERREAFQYQPRHVQEAWLEEAPVPNTHWTENQKTAFGKLPREAQEILLEQAQEIERGYGQKFQTLANDRKLAESIRQAVTPEIRAQMQQRGLDEPGAFTALLRLQDRAAKDPYGYIGDFIAGNRLDLNRIVRMFMGGDGGQQPQHQQNSHQLPSPQADIASHPVVAAMLAELKALRQERVEEQDRRISTDIDTITAETDGNGNSLYPFIRILAAPMAEIIESDPERFGSMGTKERFVTAYNLALQAFPELHRPAPKPEPVKVDEPEDDARDPEAEAEAETEKLRKASTKKPKTPQAAPSKGGDPFERAFARAERQVGLR
jgi:hypothetical protein